VLLLLRQGAEYRQAGSLRVHIGHVQSVRRGDALHAACASQRSVHEGGVGAEVHEVRPQRVDGLVVRVVDVPLG